MVPSAAGTTISPFHGRRRLDVPGIVGDFLETVRPVVSAAGKYLDGLVGQVNLDPVAVELDLMDPALSGQHLCDRGSQRQLDESGQRRLDADRLGLPTLKRHRLTPRTHDRRFKLDQPDSFPNQ